MQVKWEVSRAMYEKPSIVQSNPPSGIGCTMFGSSSPVQDGVHLGGPADESACAGSLSTGKDEC